MTVEFGKAALVRALAGLYPDDGSVRRLLEFAGIPLGLVSFSSRPVDTWHSAVTEADHRRKRVDLLKVVLLERPEDPALHAALQDALAVDTATVTVVSGPSTSPDSVEKIMGAQSTLLPIVFLEQGLKRADCVVRIVSPVGLGTGFLIADDRIVTNHHVISSADSAARATIQFNYQDGPDGSLRKHESHPLRPDLYFATSSVDDLTVVGAPPGLAERWGFIQVPDVPIGSVKRVNIIQHPGGGPKQIALYHNIVSHMDESRIQYYTDTLPGSSGSPLFDDTWRLIGVHHAGGNLYSPSEKKWVYRNEGVAVGKLVTLLASR